MIRNLVMNKLENRTARLTLLIDPDTKMAFERLCSEEDLTPSQMVRKLIRDYIEQRLGPNWRDEVLTERKAS